jgi:hypothetical protein
VRGVRAHGGGTAADQVGDVHVWEVLVVPQHENGSLLLRQPGKHRPQLIAAGGLGRSRERCSLGDRHRPQPSSSSLGHVLVEHDLAKVGARCRHGRDALPVPLSSRERCLQQVLRVVRRSGQHDRKPKRPGASAVATSAHSPVGSVWVTSTLSVTLAAMKMWRGRGDRLAPGRPGHRRLNTLRPSSGLAAGQSANTDQQMSLRRA